MTTGSPRIGRMPRDARARERLREAQQREAEALAGVCLAQEHLRKVRAKRNAAIARADATVAQANASLESAQASLARVSGVDRAALLMAVDSADVRKAAASKNGRRSET